MRRVLYSFQWRHNATPPDLHLQLVRDPQLWFDFVASLLLGALRRRAPQAIDWAPLSASRKLASISFDTAGFGHGKPIARGASTRFCDKWGKKSFS